MTTHDQPVPKMHGFAADRVCLHELRSAGMAGGCRGLAGSVGGPAAVDGQDDAGETAGGGVGRQQGGAGDLGGLGPAAGRDLGVQEPADLRVVVGAFVQRGAERAGGQGVDGDPGAGQLDSQAAVSWTTAPLLAAYPDRAAAPARPSALAMVTMRPYPAARMGPRPRGRPARCPPR